MSATMGQITGATIIYSTVCSGAYKKNIKAHRHWPWWWEFTGDPQRSSNAENVSFDDAVMILIFIANSSLVLFQMEMGVVRDGPSAIKTSTQVINTSSDPY